MTDNQTTISKRWQGNQSHLGCSFLTHLYILGVMISSQEFQIDEWLAWS